MKKRKWNLLTYNSKLNKTKLTHTQTTYWTHQNIIPHHGHTFFWTKNIATIQIEHYYINKFCIFTLIKKQNVPFLFSKFKPKPLNYAICS